MPQSNGAEEKMMTLISVLHDLRALDVLRKKLPQVYDEISKYVKIRKCIRSRKVLSPGFNRRFQP
jgi:hypothetical protein